MITKISLLLEEWFRVSSLQELWGVCSSATSVLISILTYPRVVLLVMIALIMMVVAPVLWVCVAAMMMLVMVVLAAGGEVALETVQFGNIA